MATQHFYPGWYCTTPDCGYSRDSQERDAEEMRKLQANQAWNATGSDADDEMCGKLANFSTAFFSSFLHRR